MTERKPRIAVVSPFLDKQHGTERCMAEQLERLAADYEFHVYSTRVADMDLRNIVWHRIPEVPGPHLVKYCWFFCANHVWRWFARFSDAPDFALTFSPGINCLDAELIAVHIVFAEFFERVHGKSAIHASRSGFWFRTIHRMLYYRLIIWLERRIYTRPNVPLIAVSRKVRDDLQRFYGRSNSLVVHYGIDPKKFDPQVRRQLRNQARDRLGYSPSDFVLLLIGNDWRKKGLFCLLEAIDLLGQERLKAAVVGTDDISPFRTSLDRKNLGSRVQFLPLRPDPEFYYAAADIYVGPSVEDAFGIPPLEAMGCALPVIVSRPSGVSELITHGEDGYILEDPEQPADLAALIRQLLENEELRERMGQRAAATASQYTWARNAACLHEILGCVLAEKGQKHSIAKAQVHYHEDRD
jgi:UDP-glucose:(heptosyl)LPS alpha-1,3-glucosyltransferase